MRLYPKHTEPPGGILVFCGDEEITNECTWADPATGEAEVFLRDAAGHCHTVDPEGNGPAAKKLLSGCRVKAKTEAVEKIVESAKAAPGRSDD